MNTPSLWAFWRRRPLRFWLGLGMLLSVLPLAVVAVGGYVYLDRQVVRPLAAIVQQERVVLDTAQDLPARLWDATIALKNFRVETNRVNATAFRDRALAIQATLDHLQVEVGEVTPAAASLGVAKRHWTQAARTGQTVLAMPRGVAAAEATSRLDAFELSASRAATALTEMNTDLLRRVEMRRERVQAAREQAWIAAWVAAAAALAFLVGGIVLIERSVAARIVALAAGVTRIADGDRRAPVMATLPPELVRVADAFNRMTDDFAAQEKMLEMMARTDGLTGLSNRREFDRELAEHIARAQRYGEQVGLLMIDIDRFKAFNDSFGHQGGDRALRALAVALVEVIRDVDRAFRYGGEEFAVIMPASGGEGARRMAERLCSHVAERVFGLADGKKGSVTVSIGLAVFPDAGTTPDALIAAADGALYRAKEEGRNRVCAA